MQKYDFDTEQIANYVAKTPQDCRSRSDLELYELVQVMDGFVELKINNGPLSLKRLVGVPARMNLTFPAEIFGGAEYREFFDGGTT